MKDGNARDLADMRTSTGEVTDMSCETELGQSPVLDTLGGV